MSSPSRIPTGHSSSSVRRDNHQHQHQLQHHASSYSPFHRSRHSLDHNPAFEFEPSRIPSPTSKNGVHSRRSFGQTRTLRGAFEATSRNIAAMADNTGGKISNSPIIPGVGRTPSPRQRKMSLPSPFTEVTSPPPGELLETYQRINDAVNLADLVSQDDLDLPAERRRGSGDRSDRRLSPAPVISRRADDEGNNYTSRLSFLDDMTDDSLRKKLANHVHDEERLRRVTTRESPVFGKAKVGYRRMSSEDLHRRDRDPEPEDVSDEVDESPRPRLNVPRDWGNRSRDHRQWLSSITRQNGNTPRERQPRRSVEREVDADIDFTGRSLHVSNSPPVRHALRERDAQPDVPRRNSLRTEGSRKAQVKTEVQENGATPEGDPIPNTPIVVYKASPRDRAFKPRSDSRELLRKLARTESPSQSSTPEQATPAEENPLPDKTPVVIGAWIDTPMTERVAATETTEDISREIDSPSKTRPTSSTSSTVNPAANNPPTSYNKPSQLEPSQPSTNEPETNLKPDVKAEKPKAKLETKPETKPEIKTEQPRPRAELVKPKLPKSALQAVIEDAQSNDNPLKLGDDTITSLQELIDGEDSRTINNVDTSKIDSEDSVIDVETKEMNSESGQLQTVEQDPNSLNRVNSKLQSVIHSIHDVRLGLNGLERHILPDNVIISKTGPCETCGAHHHHDHSFDGKVYLAIPLPCLWRRDTACRGGFRITYLGWSVLVFIIWYISENTMCDYYCHPTIAQVCDGYCLRPDAPKFPFTIPTMLWRWSHLSAILTPMVTIIVAFVRLLAQLLGFWDGYVDDNYDSLFSSGTAAWKDITIGSDYRNGFYAFWSGGRAAGDTAKVVTTASTTATATASSATTMLQNILSDESATLRWEGADRDAMDDDEVL